MTFHRFYGIERVDPPRRGGDPDLLLKRREAFWLFTLQTLAPKGLNDELPLNVYVYAGSYLIYFLAVFLPTLHFKLFPFSLLQGEFS